MRFGSVCSGIEAASVAWNVLGWEAAWLSEIEPFPSAALAYHYPGVPNLGDMATLPGRILAGEVEAPDLFCGGTPCQAFSVAGLRRSLDDSRGNLSLVFCEIANAIDTVRSRHGYQPAIVFWENVPGVLNTKDNAFGCFLAGLSGEDDPLLPPGGKWTNAGCVYGPKRTVAWRTLDAQYFGVAQRRRRVFVVASAREDLDPVQVLFEFEGVRRDSPPSRGQGEETAGTLASRTEGGGFPGTDESCSGYVQPVVGALTSACGPNGHGGSGLATDKGADAGHIIPVMAFGGNNQTGPIDVATARNACASASASGRMDFETETFLVQPAVCVTGDITHTLKAEGFDASEDGTGRGQPIIAFDTTQITSAANYSNPQPGAPCHPLAAGAHAPAVAFQSSQSGVRIGETHATLDANNGPRRHNGVLAEMKVRRLTPVECERLQGFPDGYTAIPWRGKPASECPDGPRYKALGNSWAVPNVRWIGRRIQDHLIGDLL